MKKILMLIMVIFVGINANAQKAHRLDSVVISKNLELGFPSTKYIYFYDDQGKNIKEISGDLEDVGENYEFNTTDIDSFIYNDQGLIQERLSWNVSNGNATLGSRTVFEYDDNGNNTYFTWQTWNSFTNDWNNAGRFTNVYEEDILTELIYEIWFNMNWTQAARFEYIYDLNSGLLIEENYYSYDIITTEETPYSRDEFFYDSNDKLELVNFSLYDEDSMSFYLARYRELYYDDFGNLNETLLTTVDSLGEEVPSQRSNLDYNTNIEVSEVDFPYNSTLNSNEHIRVGSKLENWENAEWLYIWDIDYYYSGLTDVDDVFEYHDLGVFPNPATSTLFFTNTELMESGSRIQIIKSDGSIVHNEKLSAAQLNIEDLPVGMYTILLKNKNSMFKSNFLKF